MSATNNTEFVIINGNKILKEDEEDKECLFKCGRVRAKKSRDSDCFGCSGDGCSCTSKEYWNLCDVCFEKEM